MKKKKSARNKGIQIFATHATKDNTLLFVAKCILLRWILGIFKVSWL